MKLRVNRDSSGPFVRYASKIFRPTNAQTSSLNGFVGRTTDFGNMDYVMLSLKATDEFVYVSYVEGRGIELEPGVFEHDVKERRLNLKEQLMAIIVAIDEGRLDEDIRKFHGMPNNYYQRPCVKGKTFVSIALNVAGELKEIKTEADYEQFAQRQLEYWMEKVRG